MSSLFDVQKFDERTLSPEFTLTENGALTLASSGTKVLDLFARGGAMRKASKSEIEAVFKAAYEENATLAVAILFFLRDITQGQGERNFFRTCLRWLAVKSPYLVEQLLPFVPEYGRWDDVLCLRGVQNKRGDLYTVALTQYAKQLMVDLLALREQGDKAKISLAAKWAPSESAGKASKILAKELMTVMSLSPRLYRKALSALRAHLQIVERQMCAKQFDTIDYKRVPSRAALLYRKAFSKQDKARYGAYLEAVKAGKTKINASTLYPYDIVAELRQRSGRLGTDDTLEMQWKALPDYPTSGIAVIDTSASMTWTAVSGKAYPIDVALSLGMYMAERNTSCFKNKFITFSDKPTFVEFGDGTLKSKIDKIRGCDVGSSTNLQAVFDRMLELALKYKLPEAEMPKVVYIFSDMEFNIPSSSTGKTQYAYGQASISGYSNLEVISQKYAAAGYERPKIVFWNVQARNAQSPAAFDDKGTALFSGCSPTLFKTALGGELNPIVALLTTIDVPRYHPIMNVVRNE